MKPTKLLAAALVLCGLSNLTSLAHGATGKLLAGTAKVSITPVTDEPLPDPVFARSPVLDKTDFTPMERLGELLAHETVKVLKDTIMNNYSLKIFKRIYVLMAACLAAGLSFSGKCAVAAETPPRQTTAQPRDYHFEFTLLREHAAENARRHMVLLNGHVPTGGLQRNGNPLLEFNAFPLRVTETPDKPQEAILKLGFSDGIYNKCKGGATFSGWKCEHLPYLAMSVLTYRVTLL